MNDTAPRMASDLQASSEMPSQLTSDSSSDFSLVSHPPDTSVLVNGSFSAIQDLHFGFNNASVDLSFEEMQVSIQRLLQENTELKDVVQQDHATMKQQYELMLNSKEQLEVFMKQQLQRREQAKAVIEKLQSDNAQLRQELESREESQNCKPQFEQLDEERQALKLLCDAKSEENEQQGILYQQLQMEMQELRSDCNQLKGSHAHLLVEKRELAAMNAELQAKLNAIQQSPDEFVATSEGSGRASDPQSFLVVQSNSDSAVGKSVKLEERTIKELLAQLSLEQGQSQALAAELNAEKVKVDEMSKQIQGQEEVIRRLVKGDEQKNAKERNDNLFAELQASEHKIKIANEYLQKYRERCDSQENMLTTCQSRLEEIQANDAATIKNLTSEIECLKKTFEAENMRNAEDKTHLGDLQSKVEVLMHENQQLQQEQLSKGRQSEAYYCLQMKTLQERVDALTAKLVNVEETLASRSAELTQASEELNKLQLEAEKIPILLAQVEVYKADFRAERESREALQTEKEQVLEELRAIKARQSPKSRHVEYVRQNSHHRRYGRNAESPAREGIPADVQHAVNRQPRLHNYGVDGNTLNPAEPVPEETAYICPKCQFRFDSYHPLLNHVNECLDREEV